ncbi:OmpA family protein [bacterium]|nr:OmpA family protein [bacterium]
MVFTHVPRGLIVSIDEAVFFEPNQEKLKLESLYVLNEIGFVLNKLENNFVIEGHTESIDPINSIYNANWELSLARANNITKYLMRCAKVSPEKLFTVGFGEFMPFVGNVSEQNGIDNRIDFVILDYEASR